MNKKSFSLLEIIFIIVIISIISIVAIPKIFNNIQSANIVKLKADIALIRNSIIEFKNKQILLNTNINLTTLEDNNQLLFNIVLKQPILAVEDKANSWSKISSNKYKAWIDNKLFVEFIYNSTDYSFNCDYDDNYCKELNQ